MPELRRLRYFLVVARERNFTRAAASLGVAQPALSRQVRALEDELGVELLRRTTHTFELTEAGEFLLARGPALIAAADELWRATSSYGDGAHGSVVLGYGTSAGYDTVPLLLHELGERDAGPSIATRVLATDAILAGVADGSIDVGLVRCPPSDTGLHTRLLRLERQGVLVRRDDAGAQDSGFSLDRLQGRALLLHPREANPGHYDAVLALCRSRGVEPRVLHRAVALDLAQTPVAGGDALALVGESTRSGLPGDVVWLPLEPPAAFETHLLARGLGRTAAVDRLLDEAVLVASRIGWLVDPRDGDAGAR